MGEVYAWPESNVYLVTGTTTAEVVWAQDINATLAWGVDNYRTLDGTYRNLFTGRRADVSIGALFASNFMALAALASAETAVHLHARHYSSADGSSAGFLLYSGAVDLLRYDGRDGALFHGGLDYHANLWSAY